MMIRCSSMVFAGALLAFSAVLMRPVLAQNDRTSGQDFWGAEAGKKLATPDTTTQRKCITVGKDGIYVGTLSGSLATGVEQYSLQGQFVKKWTQSFNDIHGLTSDETGTVYVFDKGASKVFACDGQGVVLRSWGSAGTGNGQFGSTGGMCHAITVDREGNVHVADYGNRRVQKFDADGNFLLKYGAAGDLPGQFRDGPAGVAATPTGEVVVYDHAAEWHHLNLFALSGAFVSRGAGGGTGTAGYAYSAAATGWANKGFGGERVMCVTKDGVLVVGAEWGGPSGAVPGASRLFYLPSFSLLHGYTTDRFKFPTYVDTRGAAATVEGHVYVVRGTGVELMERRMRFEPHLPKTVVPTPVVTNVSQQSGSAVLEIEFRVRDTDSPTVETALVGFVNGTRSWQNLVVPKTYVAPVTGILGTVTPDGTPRKVRWDAGADMPGLSFATMTFEVLAKDERPEMGVHLVSVPSDAQNPAVLKISNRQIEEESLTDLWLWLLAKGDPRVFVVGNSVALTSVGETFVSGAPLPISGPEPNFGGQVTGLRTTSGSPTVTVSSTIALRAGVAISGSGIPANARVDAVLSSTQFTMSANASSTAAWEILNYSGRMVHNGVSSTTLGRAFAYKVMNWRPVTAAEKTRATAGKYNITSVGDNSIVPLVP
jgi:hypothetical protein